MYIVKFQDRYAKNRYDLQEKKLNEWKASQKELQKRHDEINLNNSIKINNRNIAIIQKEEQYKKFYEEREKNRIE